MKFFYLTFLLLVFTKVVFAQTDAITGGRVGSGEAISCPGATVNYSISTTGTASPAYKWRITGGKVNGLTEACGGAINVVWNSGFGTGKIELFRVANCGVAISGTPSATLNVRQFSYGPASLTQGSSTACQPVTSLICGTAQTINVVFFYKTNNTDYQYPWVVANNANFVSVPTGWSVSNVTSAANGVQCLLSGTFSTVTVTVHTDGIHAGAVGVRVRGNYCDGGYTGFYGEWSTYTFSYPPIDLTQNNSPLLFCNSTSSNTVTVSSTKATSYNWTVPAGYLVNGTATSLTTTSNSVTITSPGATANGTLSVTGLSACGNSSPISIPLYFGQPVPGPVSYGVNAPPGRFSISVDPVLGATSYNWYVNAVYRGNTTLPRIVLPITGNLVCGNDYYFAAEAVGNCGTSAQSYTLAPDPLECGGGGSSFSVYPNPSASTLNVAYTQTTTINDQSKVQKQTLTPSQANDFSAILYDDKGRVLLSSSKKNGGILTMNTLNIPDGTYYLHIKSNKQTIKKQVIIKH